MQFFISGDRPNVAGLVLAGSAEFKTELSDSDMFDQRLKAAVLAVVDVSYGGPIQACGVVFFGLCGRRLNKHRKFLCLLHQ